MILSGRTNAPPFQPKAGNHFEFRWFPLALIQLTKKLVAPRFLESACPGMEQLRESLIRILHDLVGSEWWDVGLRTMNSKFEEQATPLVSAFTQDHDPRGRFENFFLLHS
jgi:hypothetical protein